MIEEIFENCRKVNEEHKELYYGPKCPKCGAQMSELKEAMKDWQCQECGYRFDKVVPRSGEMKCPKCGSYDIDVDTGTAESKQTNGEKKDES